MAKVTFIERGGAERVVDAPNGVSVLDSAHRISLEGVDGDCGGACACGTCHIYVEGGWYDRLPAPEEIEREMLSFACDVRANSRLACQIKLNDSLDGLVVRAPARQY